MRYGIFSDVHSNLEAFRVVIDYYRKEKINRYIFLGDIVGYCANPRETIALLKTLHPVSLAGNHDWAVIDKLDLEYFNFYAKKAILWTKNDLEEEDLNYLHTFKLIYQVDDFVCVHGSLKEPQKFNYIFDINDAWLNFFLFKEKICFVGHSHKKGVYFLDEKNRVFYLQDDAVKVEERGKYIINVGSVGQPRDGDWRTCLCIYDSEEKIVRFKRLEYNVKKTVDKILNNKLPPLLAFRLYEGW